jgi:hypothetical protein
MAIYIATKAFNVNENIHYWRFSSEIKPLSTTENGGCPGDRIPTFAYLRDAKVRMSLVSWLADVHVGSHRYDDRDDADDDDGMVGASNIRAAMRRGDFEQPVLSALSGAR